MIRFLLTAVALALVSGCTDPGFAGVGGVATISQAEAARCTYLTNIRGEPSVFGPLAQQGLEYTRNQVLASARDAGANAVVFEQVTPGEPVYELRAAAYRC